MTGKDKTTTIKTKSDDIADCGGIKMIKLLPPKDEEKSKTEEKSRTEKKQ